MTATDAFLSYSKKRIADLRQGIEMMEAKVLRTHEQSAGGTTVDTTNETLASYRRDLSELENLRRKFEDGASI